MPGFSAVERDGVELSGSFTARINADMRVGGLEETIKVTGETPVVDVQSTQQERVLDREVLDALPNAGLRTALGVLIPSVDFRRQDVGGAGVRAVTGNMVAHGARSEDAGTTLNGMSIASFGTGAATATIFMNPMGIQEMTIDTGSNDAELHAGGVRTNYTLREGGNTFHGVVFGAYAPGKLQSDNLTDSLIARGLTRAEQDQGELGHQPGVRRPDPARQDLVLRRGALQRELRLRRGTLLEQEHQQPERVDLRARQEPPRVERAEAAGRAGPRQLAGDAAEQARRHLLQHQLLLLPDRRLADALVGSRPACRVPLPAARHGRLDAAAHQPDAH